MMFEVSEEVKMMENTKAAYGVSNGKRKADSTLNTKSPVTLKV